MRALLSALLALTAWTLASCVPTERAVGEPALWRIADADSEIWLFGSVHLLPDDLNWRGPRLNAAFAAADENEDGELSPEEAQAATALLGSWVSLLPAAAGQSQGTSPELERRMRERMRPGGGGQEPR